MGNGKSETGKRAIRTYTDLDVYQRSLNAAKEILTRVIPRLPAVEKFDLADQLRRCCKSIPALIAEGYAKKHQPKAFKKYLEDGLGESNEMSVHLVFCRDVYGAEKGLCDRLIAEYEIIGKQLFALRRNWISYGKEQL
jgi:four helix bundle protein